MLACATGRLESQRGKGIVERRSDNMIVLIALVQDWGIKSSKKGRDSSSEKLRSLPPRYLDGMSFELPGLLPISMSC